MSISPLIGIMNACSLAKHQFSLEYTVFNSYVQLILMNHKTPLPITDGKMHALLWTEPFQFNNVNTSLDCISICAFILCTLLALL